jgi:hypothetical protein
MPVTRARLAVFGACGLLTAAFAVAPWTDRTGVLVAALMIAGAGALGLFPIYHSFTQDISGSRQGRITGIASVAAWVLPAQAQHAFGWLADHTGSFNAGLTVAAFLPLLAGLILLAGWPREGNHPAR